MPTAIEVKVKFRAGHRLLPPYVGKCNNVHGEGYTVIFRVECSELDENGMVLDFGDAKRQVKDWIDNVLYHSYMCHKDDEIGDYLIEKGMKVFEMASNPTAENIAKLLFDQFKPVFDVASKAGRLGRGLVSVGVVESFNDSIAYYTEE